MQGADFERNHKWVQLACGLVSTMLTTPEGLKYLREDKLLKQLADCFIELETVSPIKVKLSVETLQNHCIPSC